MAVTRRRRFVHAHMAWMLTGALGLAIFDALTYELFFVVSLIGLLVLVELIVPFRVTPHWRRRLRWIIGIGLLGLGYIVIRRIFRLLPQGVI
ncbi:hypothetical protein [Halorientalis persicus]|uniref:hypothetical protein n=1 Tax=Halorientalis persicus TaxID=1367881 RepID=UPI000B8277EE|nr:hypothetical protein [Halorientalis persicus]